MVHGSLSIISSHLWEEKLFEPGMIMMEDVDAERKGEMSLRQEGRRLYIEILYFVTITTDTNTNYCTKPLLFDLASNSTLFRKSGSNMDLWIRTERVPKSSKRPQIVRVVC
jgi:hypothetical protein